MNDVAHAEKRPLAMAAISGAMRNAGIAVALVLLIVVFSLTTSKFLTPLNLTNIMVQITLNIILAAGMTFVILIGGIDLSVGSVMALAGVVGATFVSNPELPTWLAILGMVIASCGVGAIAGMLNGIISAWWAIPSFIVTLGMLNMARGTALQFTQANTIYIANPAITKFGTATFAGIPVLFLVAVAIIILGWLVLNKTVFGRMLYAIGNNEEAVRLAGHNTLFYKTAAFAICGLAAGIAAIMYMARLTSASPIMGNGYELNAIAAVIIGGTSLAGGRGSMIGTLLGAAVIGVLGNGQRL